MFVVTYTACRGHVCPLVFVPFLSVRTQLCVLSSALLLVTCPACSCFLTVPSVAARTTVRSLHLQPQLENWCKNRTNATKGLTDSVLKNRVLVTKAGSSVLHPPTAVGKHIVTYKCDPHSMHMPHAGDRQPAACCATQQQHAYDQRGWLQMLVY